MPRKLNPQGLIFQKSYLFQDYAEYKDKVFSTFQKAAKRNGLPVTITEETYKSGGILASSKDVLLTVDGGFKPFCVIGSTTYGKFLSVTLYVLVEDTMLNTFTSGALRTNLQSLGYLGKDMISVRDMQAFQSCVQATLEQSFEELGLKEFNDTYKGVD